MNKSGRYILASRRRDAAHINVFVTVLSVNVLIIYMYNKIVYGIERCVWLVLQEKWARQ